jgi:hypothetical protein
MAMCIMAAEVVTHSWRLAASAEPASAVAASLMMVFMATYEQKARKEPVDNMTACDIWGIHTLNLLTNHAYNI